MRRDAPFEAHERLGASRRTLRDTGKNFSEIFPISLDANVASEDDLLDPSEIEALLNQAGGGSSEPTAEKPPAETPATPAPAEPAADGAGDDQLSPSDIDALLAGGAGATPAAPTADAAAALESAGAGDDLLDPSDIDALFAGAGGASPAQPAATNPAATNPAAGVPGAEQLINEAEANLAAAIAPSLGNANQNREDTSGATPLPLNNFAMSPGGGERSELSMLQDVELDLRIELGRTELMIEEVVALAEGSVVPLDKLAGDPVDILVNGRLIARGEVLVLNDNFCVRVAEILTPQD